MKFVVEVRAALAGQAGLGEPAVDLDLRLKRGEHDRIVRELELPDETLRRVLGQVRQAVAGLAVPLVEVAHAGAGHPRPLARGGFGAVANGAAVAHREDERDRRKDDRLHGYRMRSWPNINRTKSTSVRTASAYRSRTSGTVESARPA